MIPNNNYLLNFRQWITKNKTWVILVLIILLGAYLRLSDFSNLTRFNADQVRDAKIVDAMYEGEFPLLGPKAGGTTFKLGPAFYYLEYVSGLIFGQTPEASTLIIPILATASIAVLFFLLQIYFSANISLIITFLYATSYYAIRYTRFGWNPNAIPFFLFAFLLTILKLIAAEKNKRLKWYVILGIIMGIAMQLHTTLLILMPVVFLAAHLYIFFREKKFHFLNFLFAIFIILILHAPFLAYDIQNNGKNLKSFFSGTTTKTEKNSALSENLLLGGDFFLQGNTYVISGQEPEKKWSRPIKLIASKNTVEIMLFVLGIVFFTSGSYLLLKEFKQEQDIQKKNFLLLIASFVLLSFCLFLPIANELNLRFFMILIFLPFIFFGLIAKFITKKLDTKVGYLIVLIFALFISLVNLISYKKTYDLDNYKLKNSVYGGISLGETRRIANFISNQHARYPDFKTYYLPFEFERSLKYVLEKKEFTIESFSADDLDEKPLVFLIAEKDKSAEVLNKYSDEFEIKAMENFGRFATFSLILKNQTYKIGFITDIHAKLKKDLSLEPQLRNTINTFISQMNSKFNPDLVVQNGDFIDGTNRRGEKSFKDMGYMLSSFKKLNMPFYNVLGNHELRGFTNKEWLASVGQEKEYYHVKQQDLSIYILSGNDNADDDDSYFVSPAQFEWLEKELEQDDDLRKIVFIHYPVVTFNIQAGDKTLPEENRIALHDIFSKYGVLAVFSGHIEKLEMNEIDGVRYFVIPGMEKSKNKTVPWYDSFAEISVSSEVALDFYYKKDRLQNKHRVLKIPSPEFESIEK